MIYVSTRVTYIYYPIVCPRIMSEEACIGKAGRQQVVLEKRKMVQINQASNTMFVSLQPKNLLVQLFTSYKLHIF